MESISQERKIVMEIMDGIDAVGAEAGIMWELLQIACNELADYEQWLKAYSVDFPPTGGHMHALLDCLLDKTDAIRNNAKRSTEAFDAWSAARKAQEGAPH